MKQPNLGAIPDYLAAVSGLSRGVLLRYLQALRKRRLLPEAGAFAAVDHSVWLVLTILAGSVQRAVDFAELVNSHQSVNGVPFKAGDPDITVFDGLRDIVNLRRSGSLIAAGDIRLAQSGDASGVSISAEAINGDLWNFTFGPPVAPDHFWRITVASPALIDGLAALLGPLPILPGEPTRFIGVDAFPATAVAQHPSMTVH